MLLREPDRPLADQQRVLAVLEDRERELDRAPHRRAGPHRPEPQVPGHHRRVEFDGAVAGERRSEPGVEGGILLQHLHRRDDGGERAAGEDLRAGEGRPLASGDPVWQAGLVPRAGPPVDEDDRLRHQYSGLKARVTSLMASQSGGKRGSVAPSTRISAGTPLSDFTSRPISRRARFRWW